MVQTIQVESENLNNPQIRLCEIVRTSGSCGFNLTKSKWDPYPWVSNVDYGSPAENAGVQAGDCLLEVNGEDVLGLRVVEVANKVKAREEKVTVMLWNSGVDPQCSSDTLCCGPMPTNLQRLSTCMSNIMAALECPVCLDMVPAPAHQCVNGHLICLKCRVKTEKCPVCRIKLYKGRSLLADHIYNSLIDAFDLRGQEESQRRKLLKQKFSAQKSATKLIKPEIKLSLLNSPTYKFLNRLVRSDKCSSAENLTTNSPGKNSQKLLSPLDEIHSGLKTKSLSSNEIFKMDNQQFSNASILSKRPGSGLLDVQSTVYSKRPASYHGSAEELYKQLGTDFSHEGSMEEIERNCFCPCDPVCKNKLSVSSLFKHIQEYHKGPIIHFLKSKLEFELPLSYESSAVLTVTCFGTVFILKILDYSCKIDENSIWIWCLDNKQNFTACLTFEEDGLQTNTECQVLSIESVGWQQIQDENLAVPMIVNGNNVKLGIEIFLSSS